MKILSLESVAAKWAHATVLEHALVRAANVYGGNARQAESIHQMFASVFPCREALGAFHADLSSVLWRQHTHSAFAWPTLWQIAQGIVKFDSMDPQEPICELVASVYTRAYQTFEAQQRDRNFMVIELCELSSAGEGWRSIPQATTGVIDARQRVISGWTGATRWAQSTAGDFIYGIDRRGQEMRSHSEITMVTAKLAKHNHPGVEVAVSFGGEHPALPRANKRATFDRLSVVAKSGVEALDFLREVGKMNWHTECVGDPSAIAAKRDEVKFCMYRPAGHRGAWIESQTRGYDLIAADAPRLSDCQDSSDGMEPVNVQASRQRESA